MKQDNTERIRARILALIESEFESDAAFERAGLPIPKIVVRNGVRIENRGVVAGRPSGKSSLQISSKSYYYR